MAFDQSILLPHQRIAKDFIIEHPFCGIWLDIGGAKSLTTLAALAEIRPSGHILIIAPKTIARNSWIKEINKWGFSIRTTSLVVDDVDRPLSRAARHAIYREIPSAQPTMYFIGKDLVKDLATTMQSVSGTRNFWPFPTVVIDESQEFKNPTAVRFKALAKVRPSITRLIQLTGTPTPQSLLDVWSQIYLLDQGAALGEKYTQFRRSYFKEPYMVNGRPMGKWTIRPWAESVIHNQIKHLVLSTNNTTIPLPSVSFDTVPVTLPEHVQHAYQAFKRTQVLELATPDPTQPHRLTITADNAAILRSKLLQFAQGTVYTGENHDKDFTQVHHAKLDALTTIAQAQPPGQPLLVAYRYRADQHLIAAHLNTHHIHTEVFDGSSAMEDRWNRREIPVMLLQPASFGRGLNLQHGANELIWYTLPDSLEQWLQTCGRLRRIGQQHRVRIRSLVTTDTIDAGQPVLLSKKQITQDSLLEAVRADIRDVLTTTHRTDRVSHVVAQAA